MKAFIRFQWIIGSILAHKMMAFMAFHVKSFTKKSSSPERSVDTCHEKLLHGRLTCRNHIFQINSGCICSEIFPAASRPTWLALNKHSPGCKTKTNDSRSYDRWGVVPTWQKKGLTEFHLASYFHFLCWWPSTNHHFTDLTILQRCVGLALQHSICLMSIITTGRLTGFHFSSGLALIGLSYELAHSICEL